VSAIDKDWSSGSDPSHPAFYLPGQELRAGNSHAYWVATPCSELDDACDTDDDCCDGTGASPEVQCRIMDTSPSVRRECRAIDSCSEQDEECSDSIPCCDGLVCPPEGGVCFAEVAAKYEQQTYRREFIAKCPVGLHPKWLEFEWQALIETGTSIDFGIQTRPDEDTNYEPSPPLHYGSATVTTPDGQWDTRNAQNPTVDKLLTDNDLLSQEYLLVTMTFKPNLDETRAPTLRNWRQIYDCIPAE
jgi:hypothetical protein